MDETEGTPGNSEATLSEGTEEANGEATAQGSGSDESEEEEDPFEVAYKARLELERERLIAEAQAEAERKLRAEYEEQRQYAATEEERRRLNESFTDAIKSSRDNLKKLAIKDADGNEYGLTDEQIEQLVVQPFQRYNATAQQSISQTVYTQLAQAAIDSLPPEARESFSKQAAGKPLDQWLKLFGEHLAPETNFAKQTKKEREVAEKAAEARALARMQKVGGTPPQGGSRPEGSGKVDLTSHSSAARALADGLITNEQYLEARKKLTSGAFF